LIKAAEAASPQPKRHRRLRPVQSSTPVESEREAVQQPPQLPLGPPGHSGESESRAALSLLQKAHQQLSTRKQTIESELARIEGLRSEYEAVTAQVAALDEAIKTFQGAALK
jgi:prefoldin subunit 5